MDSANLSTPRTQKDTALSVSVNFRASARTQHEVFGCRHQDDAPFLVLTDGVDSLTIGSAYNATRDETLAFARDLVETATACLAAAETYAGTTRTLLDTVADPS
ncbi:hypothetical protein GCM10010495_15050 [Kitasatospora herbaricolor]|uniref:hypothetical protein n=1 Tax=Kitasatospora herbaricolor TaxID=68217 RepID=UPI00174D96CA|nr:hypothetical protein [Kitasatospora herbaricolor]MDQ0309307.1 hypothetical protein [Kitasatospora herbaricolor]GGV04318.1 hypothetical protein GCM10010495_15050 [Kitasatospora herbaricolor]